MYTEGLKTESGVSSVLVVESAFYSWTLPKVEGIYTTEHYAVWQALRVCQHGGERKFVTFTDSRSFPTALKNAGTVDPLLQQIIVVRHAIDGLSSSFVLLGVRVM